MKRFEIMTKEEIVELVTKCGWRPCDECPADCHIMQNENELDGITKYLTQEIKLVPRWKTINTEDDLLNFALDYHNKCIEAKSCAKCKYNTNSKYPCFVSYLLDSENVGV